MEQHVRKEKGEGSEVITPSQADIIHSSLSACVMLGTLKHIDA